MDEISYHVPLVIWVYQMTPEHNWHCSWPRNEQVWALTPVILRALRALVDGRLCTPAFNIWGQFDGFHQEYTLGLPLEVYKNEIISTLKLFFGCSKRDAAGRILQLTQAPHRAPRLLNRSLLPLFRYDHGSVIVYGKPELKLSEDFPQESRPKLEHRGWCWTWGGRPEKYEPAGVTSQ